MSCLGIAQRPMLTVVGCGSTSTRKGANVVTEHRVCPCTMTAPHMAIWLMLRSYIESQCSKGQGSLTAAWAGWQGSSGERGRVDPQPARRMLLWQAEIT